MNASRCAHQPIVFACCSSEGVFRRKGGLCLEAFVRRQRRGGTPSGHQVCTPSIRPNVRVCRSEHKQRTAYPALPTGRHPRAPHHVRPVVLGAILEGMHIGLPGGRHSGRWHRRPRRRGRHRSIRPSRTSNGWQGRCSRWIDDPGPRALGARARRMVEEHFDAKINVRRILAIMKDSVDRRRGCCRTLHDAVVTQASRPSLIDWSR